MDCIQATGPSGHTAPVPCPVMEPTKMASCGGEHLLGIVLFCSFLADFVLLGCYFNPPSPGSCDHLLLASGPSSFPLEALILLESGFLKLSSVFFLLSSDLTQHLCFIFRFS